MSDICLINPKCTELNQQEELVVTDVYIETNCQFNIGHHFLHGEFSDMIQKDFPNDIGTGLNTDW